MDNLVFYSIWAKYKILWTLPVKFYWLDEKGVYNLKYGTMKPRKVCSCMCFNRKYKLLSLSKGSIIWAYLHGSRHAKSNRVSENVGCLQRKLCIYVCACERKGKTKMKKRKRRRRKGGGAVSQNLLLCSREGQKVHPMSPLIHTFVCCYCCLVAQFCSALVIPWTVSLPISSVHGIFWARLRGWVAISFFRASFNPGIEPTFLQLLHYKWILYHWATREAPVYILYQNNHPYTGKKNFPILAKTTNCMENTYSWVSFLVS